MTVYISGAVSGTIDYQERFHLASKRLARLDYIPIDPCALPHDHGLSYEEYMKEDLKALLCCDRIYMIPGWEESRGARFELATARISGIKEIELD